MAILLKAHEGGFLAADYVNNEISDAVAQMRCIMLESVAYALNPMAFLNRQVPKLIQYVIDERRKRVLKVLVHFSSMGV